MIMHIIITKTVLGNQVPNQGRDASKAQNSQYCNGLSSERETHYTRVKDIRLSP